ncbi:MAG: stage III sporulation protein AF [Clostridiales bacterium]|jgi:stage III sporulation protein AF|nr:stage III sporulation protein AF [Clostridiales bacterium]
MNSVIQWATVVCLAAVVGAMVELVTPSGRMEKMVRFVLGAFMICAIITPLTGTAFKITFDFSDSSPQNQERIESFEEQLDRQTLQVAANNIKALAQEALAEEGITPQKIEVFMDTSDKNSISITNLAVSLDQSQEASRVKARQILESKLGLVTEVTIDER